MNQMTKSGLRSCEEAFDRLLSGAPRVEAHVGLSPQKITSGVVSVEAGFDRGYLKSARISHQPLIARINAYRKSKGAIEGSSNKPVDVALLHSARSKVLRLESELAVVVRQRAAVIAQNVQLHERVRVLELQVKKLQGNISYR